MARSSGRIPRMFIDVAFSAGVSVDLNAAQSSYVVSVLRLDQGATVLVFNGRDGEWQALLERADKRRAVLTLQSQTWPQQSGPDIQYVFAPLKKARLDYMVQKATELGACALRPVMTAYTQADRVNTDRMRANAIEAAEQCGLVALPDIMEPVSLTALIEKWDARRALIFCDEAAEISNPLEALKRLPGGPMAVLVGPEGGFSPGERTLLRSRPFVHAMSLGPRIMRSDTAAIAALSVVNAVHGDWR